MNYRILFVCLGNICRSPAGENIFRHRIQRTEWKDRLLIDSAGTIGFHKGKQPDARMTKTLRSRLIPVTGTSRPLTAEDLEEFDLILTMDDENYRDTIALDPSGKHHTKVKRFTDFSKNYEDSYVPDPYYGGQEGFEHVANLIEDGAEGLLEFIEQEMSAGE